MDGLSRPIPRTAVLLLAAVALFFALSGVAVAGGWAVTQFDETPLEWEKGATYDLGFTILQHGTRPVDVDDAHLIFRSDSGEVVEFSATAIEGEGRYESDVTLPRAGEWTWAISQGPFQIQELGRIQVAPSASVGSTSSIDILRVALPIATAVSIGLFVLQVVTHRRRLAEPLTSGG